MKKRKVKNDSKRATEAAVLAAKAPPATGSWRPFPHSAIIRALEGALEKRGLEIAAREYSLGLGGSRVFGVWDFAFVDADGPEYRPVICFRNSTSKQFAFGVCSGARTTDGVLLLSSDFVLFRRYSETTDSGDLERFADDAVGLAIDNYTEFRAWLGHLDEAGGLSVGNLLLLGTAAVKDGILPISYWIDYVDLLIGPNRKYSASLLGAYYAMADLWSGRSFLASQYKYLALNRLFRYTAPLLLESLMLNPAASGLPWLGFDNILEMAKAEAAAAESARVAPWSRDRLKDEASE